MNVLEKVARNHTLWLKMVLNMGCNPSMAEDIVQQMYLRIDRLVKEGKNVMYDDESANRFYIYLTLKSMYIDKAYSSKEAPQQMNQQQVEQATGLSLDKLVKELGIGRSSIYNTIKNHREIIQEKFSEDVEDFYNKDYDKI